MVIKETSTVVSNLHSIGIIKKTQPILTSIIKISPEQAQSGGSDEVQIWVENGNNNNRQRPPYNFYSNWRPMRTTMVNFSNGQMNRPNRRESTQIDDVSVEDQSTD